MSDTRHQTHHTLIASTTGIIIEDHCARLFLSWGGLHDEMTPHQPLQQPLLIVAACSSNLREFDVETRLQRYASLHGFRLHFAVPAKGEVAFYEKPTTLIRAAAITPSAVQWMWWIDCDTAILDEQVDARHLLAESLLAAGDPAPSFIASYETWGDHLGGYPINTGSFFVRKDEAGMRILRVWEHACKKKRNLITINWNRDQTALARTKGFVNVPRGSRGIHRLFNGTAVALPDAPFNALVCPAIVRPGLNAVLLLHLARGTHSIGRCAPWYNPRQNGSDYSKEALVRLAIERGVRAVWDRCCRCYPSIVDAARRAGDNTSILPSSRDCASYRHT